MHAFGKRSLAAVLLAAALAGRAEDPPSRAPVTVPAATPRPDDVGTIDGIMKAFYEVVSGPPGQPRQWGRDRSLSIADVRFVAMSEGRDGQPIARIQSHQQFVEASNAALVRDGFEEREIHRVTKRFGNIAHVFSTYETRRRAGGEPTGRGINSLQLFWDGRRWWIASAIWDEERADNPIPREFLP